MKIILLWKFVIRYAEFIYNKWNKNYGIRGDGWKYGRFEGNYVFNKDGRSIPPRVAFVGA